MHSKKKKKKIMDGSTRVRGWMALTPTPVYSSREGLFDPAHNAIRQAALASLLLTLCSRDLVNLLVYPGPGYERAPVGLYTSQAQPQVTEHRHTQTLHFLTTLIKAFHELPPHPFVTMLCYGYSVCTQFFHSHYHNVMPRFFSISSSPEWSSR